MWYSLIVSAIYALVWSTWPSIADGALVGFIALLLLGPAIWSERRRWRHRD